MNSKINQEITGGKNTLIIIIIIIIITIIMCSSVGMEFGLLFGQ
jgi:flagellar basal body-associated protein FliL